MTGASPLFDRVVQLAELLRRSGIQVSTGELIDACEALEHLDLLDRGALQAGLRAAMVKEIGRTGISSSIWEKAGSLTEREWELIKPGIRDHTSAVTAGTSRMSCR